MAKPFLVSRCSVILVFVSRWIILIGQLVTLYSNSVLTDINMVVLTKLVKVSGGSSTKIRSIEKPFTFLNDKRKTVTVYVWSSSSSVKFLEVSQLVFQALSLSLYVSGELLTSLSGLVSLPFWYFQAEDPNLSWAPMSSWWPLVLLALQAQPLRY